MNGNRVKPVVLTILDGFGYRAEREGNAIALARKPTWDILLKEYPSTLVQTSGEAVGLPPGQMGNSEVGHLNIGAGRIIYMDITRIDLAIRQGELFRNELLLSAIERGKQKQLHLLGLVSDGGVHSHINHLCALLQMAAQNGVRRVFVHAFMDGRDTPPNSGVEFLADLQSKMAEIGVGQIATVSGRYYAMDRDNRWERIERAYRAIVHGEGIKNPDPLDAVRRSYAEGVTDEFIVPIVITDAAGEARSRIQDDDAVIFFNFRADRARQMTRALSEEGFDKFVDAKRPRNLCYVCMTRYDKTFRVPYVFGPQTIDHILANVFTAYNLRNLRLAETEKYAHVTYFFNGGVERAYPGEERVLVPSPKVATYDLKPEMSASEITDKLVAAIEKNEFDVTVVNFANADMVGHSGKLEAAIKAVEAVDACLGRVYPALQARGGVWIITADHGNAETMIDPETGGPHTFHTTNPVPLVLVSRASGVTLRSGGALQDIAPTLLGLLGLPRPEEMAGRDLRILPG